MKVLVTGGAGYIGSILSGELLDRGHEVKVVDALFFGGDSILPYLNHSRFSFNKMDILDRDLEAHLKGVDAVIHLAAIVGFPACQRIGEEESWRINTEGVKRVFQHAEKMGVGRFLFASTYSNYGIAEDDQPVTETSPLHPQSLYAETKIAAETFLLEQAATASCAPLIFRFATLYGLSPRTRFDLMVNQFVLEAIQTHELLIYQKRYARSFVHIRDIVQALCLGLEAPEELIRGEIYNVGTDEGNYTKEELVELIQAHVPGTRVEYKDLYFDGDMRNVRVSFQKIRQKLDFAANYDIVYGIQEIRDAIRAGLIHDPADSRYRNAPSLIKD
jgi:nucleoside-diphosphate-sugar epimerase